MSDDIPAAELDAIVVQLLEAGLIEVYVSEYGHEACRLTAEGEPVARAIAMSAEGGGAIVKALLHASAGS